MFKTLLSMAAVLGVAGAVISLAPTVSAAENEKVTICHRTDSATNPYVKITVDQSAADGIAGNSGGQADHFGEHKGPVATSQTVAQGYKDSKTEWGDIIPPIAGAHGGLNWTAEGQAIYNNGCAYVTPGSGGGGGGGGGGGVTTSGGGGGSTLGASTGSGTPAKPQVKVTPTQGVNAGGGGGANSPLPALIGFIGSLGAVAYGALRFNRFNS